MISKKERERKVCKENIDYRGEQKTKITRYYERGGVREGE